MNPEVELVRKLLSDTVDIDESLAPAQFVFEESGAVTVWWCWGRKKVRLNPKMARHVRGYFEEMFRCLYLGEVDHPRTFRRIRVEPGRKFIILPHGKSMGIPGSKFEVSLPIDVAVQVARIQRAAEETESQPGEGAMTVYTYTGSYEENQAIKWP